VQDVAGEHRQQRRRPAEQHGDQVERHRAEHGRRTEDEAHALECVGERGRMRLVGEVGPPDHRGDEQHRDGAQAGGERSDDERRGRAHEMQQAGRDGTRDGAELPHGSVHRHHARQLVGRHARGQHRPVGRRGVRLPDADEQGQRIQRPHARVPRRGVEADARRRKRDHAEAEDRHQPPVAVVGGVAGRQGEEQRRHEFGQPDQTEHERIAAAGIPLPAERGLHSERRGGGEQLARKQQDEAAPHLEPAQSARTRPPSTSCAVPDR
jgi:hypothetical protein